MFYKTIKCQIPSTKLQIKLKFQYPMTKTTKAVNWYRFEKLALLVLMSFRTKVEQSFVWNFNNYHSATNLTVVDCLVK